MVSKVTPDTMMSASRLPSLMGYSKYNTPNDELQYSIRALQGIDRPDIGNEAMAWGNHMEPLILSEAARRLELSDVVLDYPEAKYHPAIPLCCSLDGTGDGRGQVIRTDPDKGIYVVGQDSIQLHGVGVLEAKLTSTRPEEMPALYRGPIQLQGQMDILQAQWGAVCVLYGGTELRVFLFAPHIGTVTRIVEAVKDFQWRLDNWKVNGEIDFYPPASSKDADRMYPEAEDIEVTLPAKAEQLVEKIRLAQAAALQAETDRSKAEADLKVLMGKATTGLIGDWKVSWPMRHYTAKPAKVTPAKEAYSIRQSNLSIKERK
jgi:predicted phage-related endonuclease